jgi:hypothetical protein
MPFVRLDNPNRQIGIAASVTRVFKHGVSFAHTGGITEKYFKFPPVYFSFLSLDPY